MSGATPATPRLAATVVLLREGAAGVEVLLLRRPASMAFMGGVWVFPGGRLDAEDLSAAALGSVPPGALADCEARWATAPGPRCSAQEAVGLHVAACRETFEEAGVLLVRRDDGGACPAELARALCGERERIGADAAAFAAALRRERLRIDVGGLVAWSRWITPPGEARRFDTFFFAAALPDGQQVALNAESTAHVWIGPGEALAAFARGELAFVPPTVVTLHEVVDALDRHGSLAAALAGEARRELVAVAPKLRVVGGVTTAVFPWDPEYATLPGEGVLLAAVPERFRDLPSRLNLPARPRQG